MTRFGYQKAKDLEKLGWAIKEEPPFSVRCGDPIMISPYNGKEYNPYEAEKIETTRRNLATVLDDYLNVTA